MPANADTAADETNGLVAAYLYDGASARRHHVTAAAESEGLAVSGEDSEERIAWPCLTWIDRLPEGLLLGRTDRPGWRLMLSADAPADLIARLPARPRYGRWVDRLGFGKSLVCFAAISALVGYIAINTPGWLGRRLPMSWETGMSDDGLKDLAANTCHTKESDAALAQLVARLDQTRPDGDETPIRVELIKADIVNAVALPGGRVLVFDGLARSLRSPDALAGVVGHEIGHVRQRHVMQAMLREFGISMVLSGFKSGVTNTLGRMTALRYSREAETEADNWSRAQMAKAVISPVATAQFFEAAADQTGEAGFAMAAYLNSHPDSASRSEAFRAAFHRDQAYKPALSDAQFRAIMLACEDDPKVKPLQP